MSNGIIIIIIVVAVVIWWCMGQSEKMTQSEMCCCAFSNGYNHIETVSECKKNGGNCNQQSDCGV